MHEVAKVHADKLKDIKRDIEESREYSKDNVERYHKFMRFVFNSSMSEAEIEALRETGKPTIEFNILESIISRHRGEFSMQQPSLSVRAADGVPLSMLNQNFTETLNIVESHLRAIFFDGSNDSLEYNVFSDLLAGGFSVMKVFTEYVNEMSFEQNLKVERVFDPTLCGFDPLARDSHKGDGRYSFEIYPMCRDDFEQEFGKDIADEMSFSRDIEGFSWSYRNEKNEDIILVAEYFVKVKKKETIVKLSNGHVVTKREYDKFLKKWHEIGAIEQPPIVVGKPRKTFITSIERFRVCETTVLDHCTTNFKYLPHVYFDGNSVNITESGTSTQMSRPYIYHALGIQKLKNYAGQSLANELENTIQHKFMVASESLPAEEDYLEAYRDVQKADVLIYNYFDEKNPGSALPQPREVARTPIPPQITDTFRLSDEMTQAILGSYQTAAGAASPQISGVAYARSAMQSNNASRPYLVGFIKGLNRVAQIIVDLIPKYYRTPRSLPVLKNDGKRSYEQINKPGSIYMNYDPNSLQVKVETGVNFAIQKEIALQTITSLMKSSPVFEQFMNRHGLQILLDNIDIRGIDGLKQKAEEFEKEMEKANIANQQIQQKQAARQDKMADIAVQEAQKNLQTPTKQQVDIMKIQSDQQLERTELQMKYQKDQDDIAIKSAEVEVKQRNSDANYLDIISKIRSQETQDEIEMDKVDAENMRTQVEGAIKLSQHVKDLSKDIEELKE